MNYYSLPLKRRNFVGLFLLFFLLRTIPVLAQAPAWDWVLSTPGTTRGHDIVTDAAGNLYVSGTYSGTVQLGSTSLTAIGRMDGYVAKLNSSGVYQWAARVGGEAGSDVFHQDLAVDSSGNVYVTGIFEGFTCDLGPYSFTNAYDQGFFVAKLDANGNWQWVSSSPTGTSWSNHLVLDGQDHVYVSGIFVGPLTLGQDTLTTRGAVGAGAGATDIFVGKLSTADGTWQWGVQAETLGYDDCNALAIDPQGGIYIGGTYSRAFTAGTTSLPTPSDFYDGFIAKLQSTGTWEWARAISGSDYDNIVQLAVSTDGQIYAAGTQTSPTITLGTTTLAYDTTEAGGQSFIGQLTSTGTWSRAIAFDELGDWPTLVPGDNGELYVAGSFRRDTLALGAHQLVNGCVIPNRTAIFVAKLAADQTWAWAVRAGGVFGNTANDLTRDATRRLLVTGYAYTPATFGTLTLPSSPGSGVSGFVSRLTEQPLGLPAFSTASASFGLAPNPAHNTVQISGIGQAPVTLLDALGRTVREYPAHTATLDVRGVPAGLYSVRRGAAVKRLVIE